MSSLYIFIILRVLDNLTTYLAMSKYGGWDKIEGNPMNAVLIQLVGFPIFPILNILISLGAFYVLWRVSKNAVWVVNLIMLAVVCVNSYCAFLI